jgi:hypothetical protein
LGYRGLTFWFQLYTCVNVCMYEKGTNLYIQSFLLNLWKHSCFVVSSSSFLFFFFFFLFLIQIQCILDIASNESPSWQLVNRHFQSSQDFIFHVFSGPKYACNFFLRL